MTSLLSLPNELLINIFASCPTAQTAVCLSGVNKELHAIWLKHTRQILEGIARSLGPADVYVYAAFLARIQSWLLPEDELADAIQLSSVDQTPDVLQFSLLHRNASLASSTITAWKASLKSLPARDWRRSHAFPDAYLSYYLIRMLVVLHRCTDERPEDLRILHSLLSGATKTTLYTVDELCSFFHEVRHDDLGLQHGVMKDEKDRNTDDEMTQGSYSLDWDYACQVVKAALYQRLHVAYMLEDVIFNPPEWWPYELV
jgi:hypothetical protein